MDRTEKGPSNARVIEGGRSRRDISALYYSRAGWGEEHSRVCGKHFPRFPRQVLSRLFCSSAAPPAAHTLVPSQATHTHNTDIHTFTHITEILVYPSPRKKTRYSSLHPRFLHRGYSSSSSWVSRCFSTSYSRSSLKRPRTRRPHHSHQLDILQPVGSRRWKVHTLYNHWTARNFNSRAQGGRNYPLITFFY